MCFKKPYKPTASLSENSAVHPSPCTHCWAQSAWRGQETAQLVTWYGKQHHWYWKCCSPWSEGSSHPGSCCGCPGSARTLPSDPCHGSLSLRSDRPWTALHWSYATGVPLSPCLVPSEVMRWQPPGRPSCYGWGHKRWYRFHCQLRFPADSYSCWVQILCGPHRTTSHHCGHSMHCWRGYCYWSGLSSGYQTAKEA